MKKLYHFLLVALLFFVNSGYSQVAINTSGNNANSSAMLDVESTTKGILIPRMTTAQRTAISSPAAGLLVFDTTTGTFWFHNGAAWTEINTANSWGLTGNSNTNPNTNYIGTSDIADLKFRISGTNAGALTNVGNAFFGLHSGEGAPLGWENTALGSYSLYATLLGEKNTALGFMSLYNNNTGSSNTAIGDRALVGSDNSQNTAVGAKAFETVLYGNQNTAIGYGTNFPFNATISNTTIIGSKATATASNSLILGSINGLNGATADVNVGIGTTAPTGRLHVKHNSNPVPTVWLEESEDDFTRMRFTNTNAQSFWEFNSYVNSNNSLARMEFWNKTPSTLTTPFVLYGNGNATLAGVLTQNSDRRLKKNIQPVHNALDAIKALNGYSYYWKDNNRDASIQIGVIAQEVQKIFPSLVKEDDKGILSVNYSGLIPVLIEAVKEQQKQIEELKQLLMDEVKRKN